MYTILIADDNAHVRDMLRAAFEDEPEMNVAIMPSAVDLLKTAMAVPPDLVILDLAMPILNGLDAFGILRELTATRDVPILFLTGNADRIDGLPLRGRHAVLAKPCNIADLYAQVRALLKDPGIAAKTT